MLRSIALSHLLQVLIYLIVLFVEPCTSGSQTTNPACQLNIIKIYEEYEYIREGDIMLGGVIGVNSFMINYMQWNEGYSRRLCVEILPQYYRHLMDFRLAIDLINKDSSFFPNLTLGYHLYDSCGDAAKAVRSVLQILSGTREPVPNYSCRAKRNIAGFIGDLTSETTVPIAQILSLYGYSQISSGATDTFLSDRVTFPYFFRTLQSDHGHYSVLSKLLKQFGWTWIGIIRLDDYGGEKEHQLLTNYLSSDGICVEFTIKLKSLDDTAESEKEGQIRKFKNTIETSSSSIIVLCGTLSTGGVGILKTFKEEFNNKTLVLSYTISSNYHIIDYALDIFNGSLGMTQSLPLEESSAVKQFLKNIHPSKFPEDKLLEDIWMQYHSCMSKDQSKNDFYKNVYDMEFYNCTGKESISKVRHFDNILHVPQVAFAAKIMARAIQDMHMSFNQKSPGNINKYRNQLHHYLKNLQYKIFNTTLSFDDNGELTNKYLFYYLTIKSYKELIIAHVGLFTPWEQSHQKFNIDTNLRWRTNNSKIPVSQCSDNCVPGFRKAPRYGAPICCYTCVLCSEGEISYKDSENCFPCSDMEWPNEKRNQCVVKMESFLSYTNDVISVCFSSISVLFFIITLAILGMFISYQDTPIVRANNKSLSFLLLVSIKLSFLSVFLFLGRPVDITCMLRIITFGITFSIAVSSLLAKTIIVCVAFKATKPGSSWRKWVGVKLPISVVLFCSSIQIIICMTWLAISPPFQELDIHTYPGTIIIQCNEGSAIGFYSVIGYMGLLAAVSFVLAFLARTLPDTFNEAKYITFSMLLFCSVWITMIPAYLSTKGKNTVCVEIFAILTSSAGLLACIFLPKCYIILFRPEMNTKSNLLETRCHNLTKSL
ncbi:vomeronasal type-2 receptor 26 [Xenopus laevis]|uniref:Vomeronasal type-2 receptor 26 n=2 Tax=Xenopus laevis TaxID=8355 RepID=A0A1L8HST2_XENLA|nr:vomeronasal type-2 receptor 26 [Xenopus laevis]OCT99164.1 hypothetical protein XELAEV_18004955mg [Xenopus laevis]